MRDQLRAVGGVADGGGGDGAEPRRLHLARQPGKSGKRVRRARHALGFDRARGGESATEACEHLFVEQDRGNARGALVHDEADRVGADVDDRGARVRSVGFAKSSRKGGEKTHADAALLPSPAKAGAHLERYSWAPAFAGEGVTERKRTS